MSAFITIILAALITVGLFFAIWKLAPYWSTGKKTLMSLIGLVSATGVQILQVLSILPGIITPELAAATFGLVSDQGLAGMQVAFLLLTAYGTWDKQKRLNMAERTMLKPLDEAGI